MTWRVAGLMTAVLFAACASRTPGVPSRAIALPATLPRPVFARSDAAPKILGMYFSTGDVQRGQTLRGRIVTTTNVASVEVRTSLFSINVPRRGFGDFSFTLRVLDVPPIFLRAYRLRVIARNARGAGSEEDVPFRIR